MKKWICMSDECHCRCEVGSMKDAMTPHKCPYISTGKANWVEKEEPYKGFVDKALREAQEKIAKKIYPLPKLTAEVFDRPDCPEDAKIAVVNMDGSASWGDFRHRHGKSFRELECCR